MLRIDQERALVQTLDFFPPIVDDPRWFGRIAAANSLSDVFAMGGRPLTAMNIVGWPRELDVEILGEILAGYSNVIVPEMNLGQLTNLLRAEFLVDAKVISKVSGQPFTAAELVARIQEATR